MKLKDPPKLILCSVKASKERMGNRIKERDRKTNEETGAAETTQEVKCLLCGQEGLNLDSQHSCKNPGIVAYLY